MVLALVNSSLIVRAQGGRFGETDLVSDIPGRAKFTDPNLVNPWGIAFGPTSPFWTANNHSGTSTLYNTAGMPLPLVVSLPGPSGGLTSPTGQVFNGNGGVFNGDRFIFSSEDGVISGWRGSLGTAAEVLGVSPTGNSVYKGLAIGSVGGGSYLYASDFHNGRIDVFGSTGSPSLAGSFADPTIPAGFAPFNIQNIGNMLYVTYAKQDNPADAEDDVAGAGNGFIDVFDLSGNFMKRLVSNGGLNSPWGLAMAPAGFGGMGGKLLVGNFGDGVINAYDPMTGAFFDALRGNNEDPLSIEGLWGLTFGNGGSGGRTDTLYFTAGISGGGAVEDHGLFGAIAPVPEASTIFAGAFCLLIGAAVILRRRRLVVTAS
jgi:uncharacterized protein (TIGR03118 family)